MEDQDDDEDWEDEDWEEESPYTIGGPDDEDDEDDAWGDLESGAKLSAGGARRLASEDMPRFNKRGEPLPERPRGRFAAGAEEEEDFPMDDDDGLEEYPMGGPMGSMGGGEADYPMDDDGDDMGYPMGSTGDWPKDSGDEDWDDEAGFGFEQAMRYEDLPEGEGALELGGSGVFDGMDGPADEGPEAPVTARELSLLYDDFETNGKKPWKTHKEPTDKDGAEAVPVKRASESTKLDKGRRRKLESLEEREYVVAAEGIAVRVLPDEKAPRTGEIIRQGEKFTAIEAVDGQGDDRRMYLRLPEGRGWVFDDERIFPGFPSVKLVRVGGLSVEEEGPEPVKRPLVAVVGRPNVGKSTLVNRICDLPDIFGQITFDEAGVTRDRTYKEAEHTDDCGDTYMFEVIDTGGLIFYDDLESVTFKEEIRTQIDTAMRECAACIMVVDSQTGPVADDYEIAAYLKKVYIPLGLKVVLAVAKCDRLETMDANTAEFWGLDIGEPLPVCSIHGRGVWEVVDAVINRGCDGLFPMRIRGVEPPPSPRESAVSIAIVGRTNAGKSSLLNAMVGEARAIVSDIPGTTTDAIDAYLETEGGKIYRFVDTAGIRRRGRIKPGTEWLAVNRAIKAVKRADVALMVLDASEIMTGNRSKGLAYWCPDNQQRYIARQIEMQGTACVVVLTKWDAVPNKDEKTLRQFTEAIRSNLGGVGQWAEVVACSSLTGQRLGKVLAAVDKTMEAHRKRIPTPVLNEVVRDALLWRLPSSKAYNKKQGRIYYSVQVSSEPPVIALFCNNPKLFGPNYKTYMENKLRQDLGWFGTPMLLEWRKRSERRARSQADQWLTPRLQPDPVWR